MRVSRLLFAALLLIAGVVIYFSRDIRAGRDEPATSESLVQEQEVRNASMVADTPEMPAVPEFAAPQASDDWVTSDPPSTSVPDQPAPANPAGLRAVARTMTESVNPDIGEALGLTPGEADALLELLATHRENLVASAQSTWDLRERPEELAAAMNARMRAEEVELQALLGHRYSRWKDYDSLLRPAWQLRKGVRTALEAAGMPITDAQTTTLTSALEVEVRAFAEAGRSFSEVVMPGTLQLTTERRQKLVDAAAPHLTPLQLETFREVVSTGGGRDNFRVN